MLWLLKSPAHQQACYWLCRTESIYFCSRANYTPAQWSWRGVCWNSPCPSVRLSICPSVDDMVSGAIVKYALEFQFKISYVYFWWLWAEAYLFSVMSLSKWPSGSHIGYFGFQILILVWLWISSPILLIFSTVTFKMVAWWPCWIFRYLDSIGGMVSGA